LAQCSKLSLELIDILYAQIIAVNLQHIVISGFTELQHLLQCATLAFKFVYVCNWLVVLEVNSCTM